MDLMDGPGHTNLVCSMVTTADRLHSLGLDKNLKTASTSTNEYRYGGEGVRKKGRKHKEE